MNLDSSFNMAVSTAMYIVFNTVFNLCISVGLFGSKEQKLLQFFRNPKLMVSLAVLNGASYLCYNVAKQTMMGAFLAYLAIITSLIPIRKMNIQVLYFNVALVMVTAPFVQVINTGPLVFMGYFESLLLNTVQGYLITLYLVITNIIAYWVIKRIVKLRFFRDYKPNHYRDLMLVPLISIFFIMAIFFEYGRTTTSSNRYLETLVFSVMVGIVVFLSYKCMKEIKKALNMQQIEAKQLVSRSLMAEYLQSRHDLKNKLTAVENLTAHENLAMAMWHSKTDEIYSAGIIMNGTVELSSLRNVDLKTDMCLATILGILLDNCKEHLQKHPHLPQIIEVSGSAGENLRISNSLDETVRHKVDRFYKSGFTTKIKDVKAGYGLHNAQDNAKEIQAKIKLEYDDKTKQLHALLVFENPSEGATACIQ